MPDDLAVRIAALEARMRTLEIAIERLAPPPEMTAELRALLDQTAYDDDVH